MVCERVTVPGPQITGDVSISGYSVTTDVNEITATFDIVNSANARADGTVEIVLNGRTEESIQFDLSPGGSDGRTVNITTNVPTGEEQEFNVCAEVAEVNF